VRRTSCESLVTRNARCWHQSAVVERPLYVGFAG